MLCKADIYQLTAALSALLLGMLVYLFERPAESVYLFTLFPISPASHFNMFGLFGHWLPSLVHSYAFILLTVVAVGNHSKVIFYSCLFWMAIGWLFEWGQHPDIAIKLEANIQQWFPETPLLETTANYFQYGTFDPLDLLATFFGTVAAWATNQWSQNTASGNEV
jgi:hypothetical protein